MIFFLWTFFVAVDCNPVVELSIEHELLRGTVKNLQSGCRINVHYDDQKVITYENNNTAFFEFSVLSNFASITNSKFLTLIYFKCIPNRPTDMISEHISLLQRRCLFTPFTSKSECVAIVNHVCHGLINSNTPLCEGSSDLLERICDFDCKGTVQVKNYTCDSAEMRRELQPTNLFQRYRDVNESSDGHPCLLWTDARLEKLATQFILPYVDHNWCFKLPGMASYHCAVYVANEVSIQSCVKRDKTPLRARKPDLSTDSAMTNYYIIWSTCIIVVVLCGVAICILFWRCLRFRRANPPDDKVDDSRQTNPVILNVQSLLDSNAYVDLNGAVVFSKSVKKALLGDRLEVEKSDIVHVNVCGEGQQGRISVALMKNSSKKVIVKRSRDLDDKELEREALFLNDLQHPNILKILGVCSLESPLWVVLEYVPMGDLKRVLCERGNEFDLFTLLMFCQQVWYGMRHMSGRLIVHRDLAARNCLLTEMGTVKISDFGMSDLLDSEDDCVEMEADAEMPVRWMPPEALSFCRYFLLSDVWQFGVLMWEIFSLGKTPYQELSCEEVICYVKNAKVLGKTSIIEYPDSFYVFMRRCFNYNFLERPNFLNDLDTESLICLADDLKLWLNDPEHRNKSFYANVNLLQIT